MGLFLPQRWRRQPQYPVGINLGNPLTSGLIVLVNSSQLHEANSNTVGIPKTVTKNAAPYGVGTLVAQSTAAGINFAAAKVIGAGDTTTFVLASNFTAVGSYVYMAGSYSGSVGIGLIHRHISITSQRWGVLDGATFYSSGEGTPIDSALHLFVHTRNGTNKVLYRDGILKSTTAGANLDVSTATGWVQNNLATGDTSGCNANIFMSGRYNRALSLEEIRELNANPWQLFAPIRRPIFVGGGTGPQPVTGLAKSAGGGYAAAFGISDSPGFAKAAGGGAAKASGFGASPGSAEAAGGGYAKALGEQSHDKFGAAKVAGGGRARAFGEGAVLNDAHATGGGAAKTPLGLPGYTSGTVRATGGGAAKAFGVQNVGILGRAHAAGGGISISPALANRIGQAAAGGGGAARAFSSASTHSGTAYAAGGGAARAFGAAPPPPSNVDHWIHGWPVNADGAVVLRVMP
jgi:hypothetical protein